MTETEYKARIRALGFSPHSPSRGKHTLHIWRDGKIYPIRDPESLTEAQRVDQIRQYAQEFG